MTAPTPRPSPKGAGVKGKAALRVGTLQAFPRLPRLGQSPRVTSNPSLLVGRLQPLHVVFPGQGIVFPIAVGQVWKGQRDDIRRPFIYPAIYETAEWRQRARSHFAVGPFAFRGGQRGGRRKGKARIGRNRSIFTIPDGRTAHPEVHAHPLWGVTNPLNVPSNRQAFLDPNPARATPRWFPSPVPSPRRGKGRSLGSPPRFVQRRQQNAEPNSAND